MILITAYVRSLLPAPIPMSEVPNRARLVAGSEHSFPVAASQWRSPHEVVCFLGYGTIQYTTVSIDTDTNFQTPLTAFDKGPGKNTLFSNPYWVKMSPDGKWLLWTNGSTWTAATLDGLHQRKWPVLQNNSFPKFGWLPDSRHWGLLTEGDRNNHIWMHDVTSSTVKDIPIALSSWGTNTLQFLSNDHASIISSYGFPGTNLYEVPLFSDNSTIKTDNIRTPRIASDVDTPIREMVLSPNGEQVAWLLQIAHVASPPPQRLQKLLSFLSFPHTEITESIWVSKRDGSDLRRADWLG